MTHYTAISGSPGLNQLDTYARARQLQQRVGQVAEEMSKLDGQPVDLDPAPDAVTVKGVHIKSLDQTATGSVRTERGDLSSLSVRCTDGSTLEFKKLPAGARAFVSNDLVVVQTRDGGLRITTPNGNADAAIENMRPLSIGGRILDSGRRVALTVAGTLAGAVPALGIPLNFALGSQGWASGDARVGMGMLGIAANVVGVASLAARYVSIAGHTLAPGAGPIAVAGLAVSALCAGGSAFMTSRRGS